MASFYDENPEALAEASRRKAFQDQMLEGTGLEVIVASDPENVMQARAKQEVLLIIERAWCAMQRATDNLHHVAMVAR